MKTTHVNKRSHVTAPSQPPAGTKVTQVTRPADDRLMLLPEIAAYVRRTEATLRYLRHIGGADAPPVWRQGRILVAWKSEIDAWLDAQRAADRKTA